MKYVIETFDITKRFKTAETLAPHRGMWVTKIKDLLFTKISRETPETFLAVDHVNLKVRKGELFGLVGPNGAGKTTLIKMLSCILKADEGTALINGYDINEDPKNARRQVNMVPAGGWVGFRPSLSVRENLEFFGTIYGLQEKEMAERINKSLTAVGLIDRADDSVMNLSSGMRQRMALANGLLMRTPIFFMDEPTIGIDPRGAREIREFIKKLNKDFGQTIFLTTHYLREAEILCDRVAIINQGKILACDTPENLKDKITIQTILEIHGFNISPKITATLEGIESIESAVCTIHDENIGSGTLRIYTDDSEKALPEIVHILESHGAQIRSIREDKQTLEDVFIKLCRKTQ